MSNDMKLIMENWRRVKNAAKKLQLNQLNETLRLHEDDTIRLQAGISLVRSTLDQIAADQRSTVEDEARKISAITDADRRKAVLEPYTYDAALEDQGAAATALNNLSDTDLKTILDLIAGQRDPLDASNRPMNQDPLDDPLDASNQP